MTAESFAEVLSGVAALAAEDIRSDPDGTFLYAEAAENWSSASLFKDLGNRVVYRDPSGDLLDRVLDLWNAAEPGKKWNALSLTISDGQFDAHFQYEDGWDPEEHEIDRRPRVLEAKFGGKPIDFSDP